MKSLLIALFITSNAFAFNICDYDDAAYLYRAMHAAKITPYLESTHKSGFNKSEKKLIHQTLILEEWQNHYNEAEAMEAFLDMWEGRIGDLAGAIDYFKINGDKIVHVYYYPGDNEYGAFWVDKNGQFKLVARIEDSSVICNE